MRVLALDPGARVGWASATIIPSHEKEQDAQHPDEASLTVTGHGMAYMKDAATQVRRAVVDEGRYDVVVYEKWALTAKGARVLVGSEMEWCQFIGIVRQACWDAGIKIVKQPTSALSSADRSLKCGHPSAADVAERIAKADSVSHDDGHDGSALRHLWTYFFNAYV